jgi:hypothetical protein
MIDMTSARRREARRRSADRRVARVGETYLQVM